MWIQFTYASKLCNAKYTRFIGKTCSREMSFFSPHLASNAVRLLATVITEHLVFINGKFKTKMTLLLTQ